MDKKCLLLTQTKITHISWTYPHICLQERVDQIMYKINYIIKRYYIYIFSLHGKQNKRGADVFFLLFFFFFLIHYRGKSAAESGEETPNLQGSWRHVPPGRRCFIIWSLVSSISMKYVHASFCSPMLPSMKDNNMCFCVLIFDSIGTQFEKM